MILLEQLRMIKDSLRIMERGLEIQKIKNKLPYISFHNQFQVILAFLEGSIGLDACLTLFA